jgi:hypothetical protein
MFINDTYSIQMLYVACWKLVTVIRIFKIFIPPIQEEFTKVTRIHAHFQDKVYSFIIFV